jgi:hypothetical protein
MTRPLFIDPDLIRLFLALKETTLNAIIMAMIVQRIGRMATRTKPLDLKNQDLLDLFPFLSFGSLKKNIWKLQQYGIWENKPYRQRSKMASYTNIRISWSAVAKLAKKVQKEQSQDELKAMCRRLNGE